MISIRGSFIVLSSLALSFYVLVCIVLVGGESEGSGDVTGGELEAKSLKCDE